MTKVPSFLDRTVRNLAATPTEQMDYLSRIGTPDNADELALEFESAFDAARSRLGVELVNDLDSLLALLESFGGQSRSEDWTFEALTNSELWRAVRSLASDVLRDHGPILEM